MKFGGLNACKQKREPAYIQFNRLSNTAHKAKDRFFVPVIAVKNLTVKGLKSIVSTDIILSANWLGFEFNRLKSFGVRLNNRLWNFQLWMNFLKFAALIALILEWWNPKF